MSDVAKALRQWADDMQRALGKDNPDSHALRETADYIEALEREIEIRRGSGLVSFEDWPDTDEAEARALAALGEGGES